MSILLLTALHPRTYSRKTKRRVLIVASILAIVVLAAALFFFFDDLVDSDKELTTSIPVSSKKKSINDKLNKNSDSLKRRLVRNEKGEPKSHSNQEFKNQTIKSDVQNSTYVHPKGIEMVKIPAGEFWMGSTRDDKGHLPREAPRHKQIIMEFHISKYEITNELYAKFLEENPEAEKPLFWEDDTLNAPKQPVVGVSWYGVKAFCKWADVRLPTEAEWEYACRAGTDTEFYNGGGLKEVDRIAWFNRNSGDVSHPVGQKEPNAFGLYDMLGNIIEWTSSRWGGTDFEQPEFGYPYDPYDGREDQTTNDLRILRGGAYDRAWILTRCAWRCRYEPNSRDRYYGFRVAMTPE